jgi:hypothetical protein
MNNFNTLWRNGTKLFSLYNEMKENMRANKTSFMNDMLNHFKLVRSMKTSFGYNSKTGK